VTPHSFQAHRTQLCNVPGCDCSCENCRVPPLPQSRLAEYLTSGAVLLFFVVAFGLLLWALS
jgi:hypothetical protein